MLGSYVFKKLLKHYSPADGSQVNKKSILETNLISLSVLLANEKRIKIAIIGQPGSGKSTILKNITGGKSKPIPTIGQQTDTTNWHKLLKIDFLTKYRNIIFVDIPGYDTLEHPTDSFLKFFPFSSFDKIIFVLSNKVHDSDLKMFHMLTSKFRPNVSGRVFVVRNFADGLDDQSGVKNDLDSLFNLKGLGIELAFASGRTGAGTSCIKRFCTIHSRYLGTLY